MSEIPLHNDKSLLLRIATGDEKAYAQLFTDYFDRLKSYAFKLLKSEFWAEEVVQEVFVHLWTIKDKLPEVENASAYLYKMTGNRCLDRMRRLSLEIKMQYVTNAVLHGHHAIFQDGQYDLKKLMTYIKDAVNTLPGQRRLVYSMHHEQGLSYQQIADTLNISKHTVRNQMAKALQTIRAFLMEKGVLYLLLLSHFYLF